MDVPNKPSPSQNALGRLANVIEERLRAYAAGFWAAFWPALGWTVVVAVVWSLAEALPG